MIKIYKTLNLFGSNNNLGQVNFNQRKKKRNPFNKFWKNVREDDNLHQAILRKQKAFKALGTSVSAFSFVIVIGISTSFFNPLHEREVEMLCEFQSFDIQPDFDLKRNSGKSKICSYFVTEEYEIAVDYGLRNFNSLSYSDIIILANAYQKLGRIDKAIIVYEKLSNIKEPRFKEFVEYKLAYLYLANCKIKGLGLLENIMGKDDHAYNDLAFRVYNYNPTILLSSEVKKNKLLESLTIQ